MAPGHCAGIVTATLEAYALAVNKGRRRVLHVSRSGSSTAMCGSRNIRPIVDVENIDAVVRWPYCGDCRILCDKIDDGWWWSPGGLT